MVAKPASAVTNTVIKTDPKNISAEERGAKDETEMAHRTFGRIGSARAQRELIMRLEREGNFRGRDFRYLFLK